MWLLFFSFAAFAQIDGTTVVCPKGQYSEIGDTPRLRFKSNKSHILICGKEGKKQGDDYFLNEFEVYYYNPIKKKIMPQLASTKPGERYRIYSKGRSLFFEESAYTGSKRMPVFQNSILCGDDGICSFSTLECIFNRKKHPAQHITEGLRKRLEKANCL